MDVVGDSGLILVAPRPERSSTEDLHEDAPPQRQAVQLDSVCLSELVSERDNSAKDSLLPKQEEKSLFQLLELGHNQHLSQQTHNAHVTCETDYIFVEQLSSPLKQ